MSYILTASGSSLATPVSILNGGTGQTTPLDALVALSTPFFGASGGNADWGQLSITPPLVPADPAENDRAIQEIIQVLQQLRVIA
jgi:hypothetical protein